MTKKQKLFILEELIPFILRERGHGFAMPLWSVPGKPGEICEIDYMDYTFPSCGGLLTR